MMCAVLGALVQERLEHIEPIGGPPRWSSAGACDIEGKTEAAGFAQPREEMASGRIYCWSTATFWEGAERTEPDAPQRCTEEGLDAMGRSCSWKKDVQNPTKGPDQSSLTSMLSKV